MKMKASWCPCIWLTFVILPSTSLTAAPGCPSFVSSRKLDARAGRSRTNDGIANCSDIGHSCSRGRGRGVSFSIVARGRANNVALFSDLRGGSTGQVVEDPGDDRAKGISLSLFLTYLTVMGAKCALPSTLAMLTAPNSGLAHQSATLSRQDVISRLLALSTLSIAAGKLLLGPIIDRLGGVASLQVALSTLCLCLGSIGYVTTCPTLTAMAGYWIIVDFAFSSCWAACVRTIRDTMPERRWAREIGRLAVAARSGNAISFAFFAWLLQWASSGAPSTSVGQVNSSWRWVFRASGVVQLIPLLMLSFFGASGGKLPSNIAVYDKQSTSAPRSTLKDSLSILFHQARTPEFWLHLTSRSVIMILVSFLLFIPSFMAQCFDMTSASSARVGSLFAIGCLLAVSTLAEKTYPSVAVKSGSRAVYRRKAYAMLAFLATSTACLALQSGFLRNAVALSSVQGALLMFLFGFSLAIPFYLPSSMFALKRGGEDGSATIADAFDVCGFGLLAVFNGYVARVLEVKGSVGGSVAMLLDRKRAWRPVFSWMIGGSVVAMASLFAAVWLEGRRDEDD